MTNVVAGPTTPPEISLTRYKAPQVHVTAVTSVISSEPLDGQHPPGHYQSLLLDTATGELAFHENTQHLEPWDPSWTMASDVPAGTWQRWHPGKLFKPYCSWSEPIPAQLRWAIASGARLQYLDVSAANALLEEVRPHAQELLDGLFEAGGDLDWSAAAAHAGRNIWRLCSRDGQAADAEVDHDLIDFSALVLNNPDAYQPHLLRCSLAELQDECEFIPGFIVEDSDGRNLEVLGGRAWYRTLLTSGHVLPPLDFGDWDAEHRRLAGSGITSKTTDRELWAWARQEDARAARERGVRLLGAYVAASGYREAQRAREWDRLAVLGARIAQLEKELAAVRVARHEFVLAALAAGRSDSTIATQARMSRQAVHTIRTSEHRADT